MHAIDFKKCLSRLISYEREFFPSHVPHQLTSLYIAQAISTLAISATLLFEPIYFYSIGYQLWQIMLFYFCVYSIYFVLMPLGGKIAKHHGFEHGMIYGSFFLILYFVFLQALQGTPFFVVPAALSLALYKTVYWPAYHADFAFFSSAGQRGRELSNIALFDSVVTILGPIIGGIVVSTLGFPIFFGMVCVVMLLSNIPFLLTKEIFKPSDFSYWESYRTLSAPENRRYFFGYIGMGEELIVLIAWPIFMFITFHTFLKTGFFVALSTLITVVVLLYVGRAADIKDRAVVLKIGATFNTLAWLMRLVVRGATSVLLIDFFSRTAKNIFVLPMLSGLYEHANHTAVVKAIIFFEMSLTVGKILASGLLVILFFFFPHAWHAVFVLAALFSALYFLLIGRTKHQPLKLNP